MKLFALLLYFLPLFCMGQSGTPAIGMWREHLPYQVALDVTASPEKIYCATNYSLFTVDLKTDETGRISKVSGLSETGISSIQYDAAGNKLFIAYTNSNIDVLDQRGINNIPDLKRQTTSGDKHIYRFFPAGAVCYAATGLGVLVLDAVKYEVKDLWPVSSSGGNVKIYDFVVQAGTYYAATEEGLKTLSVSAANPADFHNWQNLSGVNGLPAGPCTNVQAISGKVLAVVHDSLFVQNGNSWSLFFANGLPVTSLRASGNELMVCQSAGANSQVLALSASGQVTSTLRSANLIADPRQAISLQGDYWVADLSGGLSHWSGGRTEQYKLNSPDGIATGQMVVYNGVFYAAAGSVNSAWNYQYNPSGVYRLQDGNWTSFNGYHQPALNGVLDAIALAIDPRDQTIWVGTFGSGLLHIKSNDQVDVFKQNSPLLPPPGDPGSYRIGGLAFDSARNLWVSNFGSSRQLLVLRNNGNWISFSAPFLLSENAVAQIVIDDQNQKWIAAPLGNGLMVFNDNGTIDNAADDRWRIYRAGAGNGNLPSNEVTALAKDKSGLIWVGTTDGVGIIQCPSEAFSNTGCEALLPLATDGSFANYLFKGQTVHAIAVDGADQKWMATDNGVWLISPDGSKVLQHFTEDNSELLSNIVYSIAINGQNGEVFFGTANGICSYRAAATEAAQNTQQVLVFPNPVPPGYSGTIAIRGLPQNAIVKITETNGRLVYQTRALGGQAVWNGRYYNGGQPASGVYLVLAQDDQQQQKAVARIVFISR